MELVGIDLDRWLAALGVGSARTIPIVWLLPAFGGPGLPGSVRLGLGVALAALCLPHTLDHTPAAGGALFWLFLLAREVAVGATVGFVGSCFFRAAEAAGRLTDILRGANMAEVIAPGSQERSSPLGAAYLLLSVMIFVEIGGLGHVALALGRSYEALPLGRGVTVSALGPIAGLVLWSSAQLLTAAVGLAAPVLVALLFADVVLAAVARMVPQVPVFFVGIPLKALGGVGVVLLSIGGIATVLEQSAGQALAAMTKALSLWQ